MVSLETRYREAIERIGGAPALLQLPEGIKEVLKETTNLKVKTEMLEAIADTLAGGSYGIRGTKESGR